MTDTEQKPNNSPDNFPDKAIKSGKKTLMISLLSLLLAIISLVAILFVWQQSRHAKINLMDQQQQLNNQRQQWIGKAEDLEQRYNQLQEKSQVQAQQISQLSGMQMHQPALFALQQVISLLQAAYLQIQSHGETKTITGLLEMANQLFAQVNDPRIENLKLKLAEDLSQSKQISQTTNEEALQKLDQFNQQIQALQSVPNKITPITENKNVEANKSQTWYEKFWNKLQGLVIIRHGAEGQAPLTPTTQDLIKKEISLKIMIAEWAWLQKNKDIYQSSLQSIENWLDLYFSDAEMNSALKKQLQHLKSMNPSVQYPDVDRTLAMAIALFHEILSANSTPAQDQIQKTTPVQPQTPENKKPAEKQPQKMPLPRPNGEVAI